MKFTRFMIPFVLIVQFTGAAFSQVQLPLGASNCAIFNALNPDSSLYCAQPADLGAARGLIVNMDDAITAPVAQQTIAQISPTNAGLTIIKRPAVSKPADLKIDYRAAKSDTGYFIHFAFDSAILEKDYRDHLDRLAIVLNAPEMKQNCIKITGHTDTVGTAEYNQALSRRRAQTVFTYLTTFGKVAKSRFTLEAAGEFRPLPDKPGNSPYNRRVEFSSKSVSSGCAANN
ncbi:MAG: OmpA family protein [Rhodobacterales bacterium]